MRRILAVAAVVGLAVALGAGVAAAAHDEPDRHDIIGIELQANGDAEVHYIESYNLSNESERERFDEYEANETAREELRDRWVAEWEEAAAGARERSDLEMRIENPRVETFEQEGHGRVAVIVDWRSMARAEEDRVVVTEPFSGGYDPDVTRVALHGPPGYRRSTTRPEPARARANSSLWNPETSDLSQFHNEFVVPDGDDGDGDDGGGDGGGSGGDSNVLWTVLAAVLLAALPLAIVFFFLRRGRT